jgi:hypothetical protein
MPDIIVCQYVAKAICLLQAPHQSGEYFFEADCVALSRERVVKKQRADRHALWFCLILQRASGAIVRYIMGIGGCTMSVSFAERREMLTHEKMYSVGLGGVTLSVEDAVATGLHWT